MTLIEIMLLGAALAMDAAAVTVTNSLVYPRMTRDRAIAMPLFYGIFQMMMPVAGYYAGSLFQEIIREHSGLVVLVILGFLGARMVIEGIRKLRKGGQESEGEAESFGEEKNLSYASILLQAVATSIDAFAVGVSFNAADVDLWFSAVLIGIVTAAIVVISMAAGRKLGHLLGKYSEVAGGAVLIIIGIKAFFS